MGAQEVSTSEIIRWVSGGGAILCASVTAVIFLYSTFVTQVDSTRQEDRIIKRLDNLELKLDTLINRK